MTPLDQSYPETWKSVPGWEGLYVASTLGRVKGIGPARLPLNRRVLKGSIDRYGYRRVTLYKNRTRSFFTVHTIIAITFLGPKVSGKQVNHIDGDKLNNSLDNLEWCSPQENTTHACKNHLRRTVGEKHPLAKLSNEDVQEIRRSFATKTVRELATDYCISFQSIWRIKAVIGWTHLSQTAAPSEAPPPNG